ncbi:MAG: hypothetical protein IKA17_06645 [Clostridia bacterium]|nr:hypothetical protein [Clostridia bacterium]
MKKLLLAISTAFLVLFGITTISASAARYTTLPIMMNQYYNNYSSSFTMSDFEIYVSPNETPKYTNSASVYITGEFNNGSSMYITFYCYDASGNHIKTIDKIMYSADFEDYEGEEPYCYFDLEIPDVTASIEVGASYPGSWTNTYHYCKYMNVYSDDGRALGIHDLLLPVYENSGWHGPVWMYSLDGREIEVEYCNIKAYQKVGWYLWTDYLYQDYKRNYDSYFVSGNYADAFSMAKYGASALSGTYYESAFYTYKTKAMDAWRKKVNAPLAYTSSFCYDNGDVSINFTNVSYKTIKAFKIAFDCFDVFGTRLSTSYSSYSVEDTWLYSGNSNSYKWTSTPYKTDHIGNVRVTQVVYSDNTYWYR